MSFITKITKQIFSTEQGLIDYKKYAQMREQEGYKDYLVKYLNAFTGHMLDYMLSDTFTQLTKEEKDSRQRAYAEVYRIIQWILYPEVEAQKLQVFNLHNRKMSDATQRMGKQRKEKRQ